MIAEPAFQVVNGDESEDWVVPDVAGGPVDAQVYWFVEEHPKHKPG